jgi:glutathione S-transferase
MLTVHHLGVSQSERIVWLCEELEIAYELVRYERDPVTLLSPHYRALYPFGTAPVITDGDRVLGESGAIVDYLIARYGAGRLGRTPERPDYVDYLYWFHFANGTLMPALNLDLITRAIGIEREAETFAAWRDWWASRPFRGESKSEEQLANMLAALRTAWRERPINAYRMIEHHLGSHRYFAGPEFTAADIMMVFPLTTMRFFDPCDFSSYPNLRNYLQRIGARAAYQRAMARAEPDLRPLLN